MNKLFENEKMFEDANERMTAITKKFSPTDFPKDFVLELYCECANKACLEKVSIAYEEYIAAKAQPYAFVVKPEHYLPEFEKLVKQVMNYWIIIKKAQKMGKPFEV